MHGRKPMKKKYFNIILLYMICSIFLAGCGNKENDTTYSNLSNSENTSQTSGLNKESAFSKNVVSFEEMNYNAFLKNTTGDNVVGFNIPFGWCIDSQEDSYTSIRKGAYGRYVSISYLESPTDNPIFQDLPDSYLSVNDDGAYDEYYDSYEITKMGETSCPYGTVYKYKATITTTEKTDNSKHTFYDLMAIVSYGNDIIYISTSVSEKSVADNGSDLLDEVLQLLFDKAEPIKEVPTGYEYYLEYASSLKLLGYHMPEGWQFSDESANQQYYMTIWTEGKSLSIRLVDSDYSPELEQLYENGKEFEPTESEGFYEEYNTEQIEETDSPYGKIKIYDQLKHCKSVDFEWDSRVEIGLFKWNGQLFEIYYYDSNREAEEGYEGAIKELLPKLF